MIQLKTFTKIIEKIQTLKNKKQILSFLYEYHFNEIHHNLELEVLKANNFGLIDGSGLDINGDNLYKYGFNEYSIDKLFDYNLPPLRFEKHNEFTRIRVKLLKSGIYIVFYDLSDMSTIQFANHNLKTIKDLSDLIFTLTKHRIKSKSL